MCPLIQRAAESDLIPRELVRQFQQHRRVSSVGLQGQQQHDQGQSLFVQQATKSSSNHLLALFLFEVCVSLSDFFALRDNLSAVERSHAHSNQGHTPLSSPMHSLARPPKYHDWCLPAAEAWVSVVDLKMPERVKKALELDKAPIRGDDDDNPDILHRKSARDFTTSLFLVKQFWRQIRWADSPSSKVVLLQLVKAVCKCSTIYAECANAKLAQQTKGNYYEINNKNRFELHLNDDMVATLNSVEHVYQHVSRMPRELGFEANHRHHHHQALGRRRRSSVEQHSDNTDYENDNIDIELNETVNEALDAIDVIAYGVLETLQERLRDGLRKHIFHLAYSPDSLPTADAIEPLMDFLDARIGELNSRFLKGNYVRCLHVAWESTLSELGEHHAQSVGHAPSQDIETGEKSTANTLFFDRLHEALQVLAEFFFADGRGLVGAKLYTETFNKLDVDFALAGRTTDQLMDMYYMERLEQSSYSNDAFGVLTVRVYFNHDCVFVEVLRARDVIPLDSNGKKA